MTRRHLRTTTRVLVVALVGLIATSCGAAPKYTVTQAVLDMPAYEPATRFYDTAAATCVAEYLFNHLPPAQVKTIVQGADFGQSPAILTDAETACGGPW